MIRYALACEKGHGFESWFRDSDSFEEQAARGLVSCPVCGAQRVEKQIMAPSVARTDERARSGAEESEPAAESTAVAPAPSAPAPMALLGERERAFRDLLRAMRQHVVSTAEHVGPRFADEARKMHDGVSEFRAIYGEATPEEAQALADEGIEAVAMPWLADEHH